MKSEVKIQKGKMIIGKNDVLDKVDRGTGQRKKVIRVDPESHDKCHENGESR